MATDVLGFVGLGQMGRHMAANLLAPNRTLLVFDRLPDAVSNLVSQGAVAAREAKDLAAAQVIFLSLPNGQVVRDFLIGMDGLAVHLNRGTIIVDTSTAGFHETTELAEQLRASGIDFIDAPVSGMEARARDGTLTIMCGCPPNVFARVRPYFEKIGKAILRVGDVGAGQLMKLINQLLFDVNASALAEVLPMAVKLGLDAEQVMHVINSGTGRSYASEFFIPRILQRNFADGYPMKSAYKDLISGMDISARLGIPMPVLSAATATYQCALLRGHGAKDKGAMILVFEELLNVSFTDSTTVPTNVQRESALDQ